MPLKLFQTLFPTPRLLPSSHHLFTAPAPLQLKHGATKTKTSTSQLRNRRRRFPTAAISASSSPLDLTEENIEQVLVDAKTEASGFHFCKSIQIFEMLALALLVMNLHLDSCSWHNSSIHQLT